MDDCKDGAVAAAVAAAAAARHGHEGLSLSKGSRKIAKPIMEKKRRARINASLNELKSLLVEVLQKEGCRHSSKMEKADILELTVKHLRQLQKQQLQPGRSVDTSLAFDKFSSGYNECLSAVTDYLRTAATAAPVHESALAIKLLEHLSGRAPDLVDRPRPAAAAVIAATAVSSASKTCDSSAASAAPLSTPSSSVSCAAAAAAASAAAHAPPATSGGRAQVVGKAVASSSSSSNELTLVLPQAAFMNATGYLIPAVYASAASTATSKMAAACKQESGGQAPLTMISFNCLNGAVSQPSGLVPAARPQPAASPMWRPW